jgi:hypothetical protein
MQASSSYGAPVHIEMTEFKTGDARQTKDSKPGQAKRDNTDRRIHVSLGLQITSVDERFTTQGVNGYSSQIEQIQLLEAKTDRTINEDLELITIKYELALRTAEIAKMALIKIKQNVCGFADIHGLSKYTNDALLNLIKPRIPQNTYEHLYVSKEPHVFNEGERACRKIQLVRSETFLEGIAAFFDAIPAFFSSLFVGGSDVRITVEGDLIADELLDAKKTTEDGLIIEQGDRSAHIQAAFRQSLSISIWIPEKCNYNAIVQLTHTSKKDRS